MYYYLPTQTVYALKLKQIFYEIMHQSKDLYHLSNFPKDSKYFCNDHKKVTGEMKDEYTRIIICEFIGLK